MGIGTKQSPRKIGYGTTGLFCRPVIERFNRIHSEIQRGGYPNCRTLGEMLEMSGKTIQRDIDFMRDRLLLPIEYDALRKGFYYTSPVTQFPTCELKVQMEKPTPDELFVLRIAEKAARKFKGTKFQESMEQGINALKFRLYGCAV
jgi:proteasome accessory factor B